MSDFFTSLIALQPFASKTTGKAVERIQGISPGTKKGLYAERTSAFGGKLPSTLVNGLQAYWNLDANGNAQVGPWNETDVGFGLQYSHIAGKVGSGAHQHHIFAGFGLAMQKATPPYTLSLPRPYSLTCWFKAFNDTQTFGAGILMGTALGLSTNLYVVTGSAGFVRVNIGGTPAPTDYPISVWHNVVVTAPTSGNPQIYVNGALAGSGGVLDPFVLSVVGGGYNNQAFIGDIDEVGAWNRVLTSTEIAELYNGGTGTSYPFGTS